jgi:RimJ/RimL family protein N-acetyltransferase
MTFDFQPPLEGKLVRMRPLEPDDLEALYEVASDPLVWEQHPVKNRHEEQNFRVFFDEALTCGGTLLALDVRTGKVIGSSRFHGHDAARNEIEIGWTFLSRDYWGGRYNGEMKWLMMEHAFRFVDAIVFRVGIENRRSQKSVEKIGARRVGTGVDAGGRGSHVYRITAADFQKRKRVPPFDTA